MDGGDFNPFADEGIEMDPNAVPLAPPTPDIPPPPPVPPSTQEAEAPAQIDIPSPDDTPDFNPFTQSEENSSSPTTSLDVSNTTDLPSIPESADEAGDSENFGQSGPTSSTDAIKSIDSSQTALIETPSMPPPDMDPPTELPQELIESEPISTGDELVIVAQMVDENQIDSTQILSMGNITSLSENNLELEGSINDISGIPPEIDDPDKPGEVLEITENDPLENLPSFEQSELEDASITNDSEFTDVPSIEDTSSESDSNKEGPNENASNIDSDDLNFEIDDEDLDLGSDLMGVEEELSLAMDESGSVEAPDFASVDEPEASASDAATSEVSEEGEEEVEFDFDDDEDSGEIEMGLSFGDDKSEASESEAPTSEEEIQESPRVVDGTLSEEIIENFSEDVSIDDQQNFDSTDDFELIDNSLSEGVVYSTSIDDDFNNFGLNSEQDLSDFVEREGLVEDLERKSIPAENSVEKISDEGLNNSHQDTVWSTDVLEVSEEAQEKKQVSSDQFSILPKLLDQITDSDYVVDIDSINLSLQLDGNIGVISEDSEANLIKGQARTNTHYGGNSQTSEVTWSSKEYQVGEWETLLNENTSFEVLRKKISAFILDNRNKLSELMEYCEYCGLIDKNPAAIYVLSEIHREIGERFATIGLKMEALMQLESSNVRQSDMLILCKELREFLPFEKELISKTIGLYRKLELEEERSNFVIQVIKECLMVNNPDLARYYFDLCFNEGMESSEFYEIGMDLLEIEGRDLGLNEWIAKAISKYGDRKDWSLRQAKSLTKANRHSEALSIYKAYLSKSDEPVAIMEEIIKTLKVLGQIDQMISYARQLSSIDPKNEIATSVLDHESVPLDKSLGFNSENPGNLDLGSLETAIDRILEEKFKKFSKLSMQNVGLKQTPPNNNINQSVEMPDPFLDEDFSSDKKNILRHKLKSLEPKISTSRSKKLLKSDFTISLQKARSLISKKMTQKDILIFLKESKELISQVDNSFDLNEDLNALKAEATQIAKLIEDPMLGFFWVNEFK
ncbi:MAG: hypothetical protein VX619_05510 [bacterium]|nr:hypothetical protein [bacterium]